MPEKTPKSANSLESLDVTRAHSSDEVESARILMREGLMDEAKRTLHRVLAHHPQYSPAIQLLAQIRDVELKSLFEPPSRFASVSRPSNPPLAKESVETVIHRLERDLDMELHDQSSWSPLESQREIWVSPPQLSDRERMDLGIAFFEMGCFADAYRELNLAEKKIRIEKTFLDEDGITMAAMITQCLIQLGRSFEAKVKLEPILSEPDLRHEDKLALYYCMGLVEESLGRVDLALGWYQKISESDLDFRDVRVRIKLMT